MQGLEECYLKKKNKNKLIFIISKQITIFSEYSSKIHVYDLYTMNNKLILEYYKEHYKI